MIEQLKILINKEIVRQKIYLSLATVTAVDIANCTCTVDPVNGDSTRFNTRLQAAIKNEGGVMVAPKVGSQVVIGYINKNQAVVLQCSDVESIRIVSGGESFKDVMNSFLNGLQTAIITTPSGAGAFAPATIQIISDTIAKINKIFI